MIDATGGRTKNFVRPWSCTGRAVAATFFVSEKFCQGGGAQISRSASSRSEQQPLPAR